MVKSSFNLGSTPIRFAQVFFKSCKLWLINAVVVPRLSFRIWESSQRPEVHTLIHRMETLNGGPGRAGFGVSVVFRSNFGSFCFRMRVGEKTLAWGHACLVIFININYSFHQIIIFIIFLCSADEIEVRRSQRSQTDIPIVGKVTKLLFYFKCYGKSFSSKVGLEYLYCDLSIYIYVTLEQQWFTNLCVYVTPRL